MKKILAVDGNSIINRAFYGIRPLSTREGLYTHAVYGFLTTMRRLTEEERPDALCVTFDRKAPTFRHKMDADYKATRKPMPEELAAQLPLSKDLCRAMGFTVIEKEGYEAYQTRLSTSLSGWMFGNILIGGLIGIAVDVTTGAWSDIEPDEINAVLTPKTPVKP